MKMMYVVVLFVSVVVIFNHAADFRRPLTPVTDNRPGPLSYQPLDPQTQRLWLPRPAHACPDVRRMRAEQTAQRMQRYQKMRPPPNGSP